MLFSIGYLKFIVVLCLFLLSEMVFCLDENSINKPLEVSSRVEFTDSIYNEPSILLLRKHVDYALMRFNSTSRDLHPLMSFYKYFFIVSRDRQKFYSSIGFEFLQKTTVGDLLSVHQDSESDDAIFSSVVNFLLDANKRFDLGLNVKISPKKNILVYTKVLGGEHFHAFLCRLLHTQYMSEDDRIMALFDYVITFSLLSKLYESELNKPFNVHKSPIKIDITRFYPQKKRIRKTASSLENYVNNGIGRENIYLGLGVVSTVGTALAVDKVSSLLAGKSFNLRNSISIAATPVIVMLGFHFMHKFFSGKNIKRDKISV